jgi:dTDP-4-amino-4,6-dideoxygalactose transaminase
MKYIGGEIEIKESDYNKSANNLNVFDHNFSFYSTGRTAIKYIFKSINPKYPILLPSFLCESIIQPYKEMDLEYNFYKIKKDLSIDMEFLRTLLKNDDFSALYFINFFGFIDNAFNLNELKKIQKDLIIIEDCTHSTFIPNLVTNKVYKGDIVFGSLRKTLAVSDGAFILNNENFSIEKPASPDTEFAKLKQLGKTLRWYNLNEIKNPSIDNIYLDLLKFAEDRLNDKIPDTRISNVANQILLNTDFSEIFYKRRENYKTLYNKFINDNSINEVGYCIKKISNSEMPYMLPYFVKKGNRNRIRNLLRENGVFTSIIWELPNELDRQTYQESFELSDGILCFPIDQRYDSRDMHSVYLTLKDIINNKL